jgi:hypothetical protein
MRSIIALLAGLMLAVPVAAQVPRTAPTVLVVAPGADVRLEQAAVRVEHAGGRVRTTLDLAFRNPTARTLEGRLQFPLQPGQQVAAFALDVGGELRDAVPVPKARGRQVLEAIERRGADPGLLEQAQGEFFRLRIYPFLPQATRRVRIVLDEAMPADGRVRLPLGFARGLGAVPLAVDTRTPPRLEGLGVGARFANRGRGAFTTTLRGADLAGRGPTLVFTDATRDAAVQVQAWRGERYFSADVPVALASAPRALPATMTLAWDSSASGAQRAHDLEFALLDAYFHATRSIDVELVRFRDTVDTPLRFRVRAGDWSELRRALESTVYDGATSLRGWTPAPGSGEVLMFTDGLFNYGDVELPAFAPRQRLYTIRAGAAGDATRLQALAAARGGDAISLDDVAGLPAARARLLDDVPRIAAIDALGAADVVALSSAAQDRVLHVAGRLTDPRARLVLDVVRGNEHTRVEVPLADAIDGSAAAPLWAQYRVAALMAAPERNRAEIARIGSTFGIVTPGSSLIVLERVEDYVRYAIAPPPALSAEYARLAAGASVERDAARAKQLELVRAQWREREQWWATPFPKDTPPAPKPEPRVAGGAAELAMRAAPEPAPAPVATAGPPPPPPSPPSPRASTAQSLDRVAVTGSRIGSAPAEIGIQLQPWTPDSPLARRLRALDADAAYAAYLDERGREPQGTAFYLDVADVLFERRRDDLALRVLSNLAEMDLDNRHVLRVLAYRLMQAGRPALAVPVLEQVLAMGDDEPQSYRDLALARAALDERQAAVDLLYEVVAGTWDDRFPGIEVTALAELNALVATSKVPLDTHRVPADLLHNMPLDLRAVLSWDADATDMDLWVTDPNGEKVYYAHRLSYQGGHISRDFTGGYGPEEFALRTAKPGRYRVEANYFGDRQQLVTGAPTLQLWLSTKFGTPAQKDQRITLRLNDPKETIFVGEFEVK